MTVDGSIVANQKNTDTDLIFWENSKYTAE